ncbi:hypothetical protein JXA84_00940 [candidate division WOR-3 bacterium]|nr:hypothetical protein [candidate division WOR-3 bacterium]
MKKNKVIKISAVFVFFSIFLLGVGSIILLFLSGVLRGVLFYVYSAIFFSLSVYLATRTVLFQKRMLTFIKSLYGGDYKVGIKQNCPVYDEFTGIVDLSNKLSERLCLFDRLRAEKVQLSFSVLDIIFNRIDQPCMLVDVEEKHFIMNRALQTLFGVKNNRFSFTSIEKNEYNTKFVRILLLALMKDKIEKKFQAPFRLPIGEITKTFWFDFIPVRGKDEKVAYALIFVEEIR